MTYRTTTGAADLERATRGDRRPPWSLTGRPFVDITAVAEKPRWKGREKEHLQDLLRPSRPSKTSGKEAKMASQRAVLGRSWGALGASSVLLGASKNTPRGPKRSQEVPKRSPRANPNGIRTFGAPFWAPLVASWGALGVSWRPLWAPSKARIPSGFAQEAPKNTPRGPKRSQEAPKRSPRANRNGIRAF